MKAQATANFTASVTIIQPIGIKTIADLNFAQVDARTGGEIILTPQEERITMGNVTLEDGLNVSAASFEITGQEGFSFSLSLPSGTSFLTNGNKQIAIKDFTSSIGDTGDFTSSTSSFKVGATIVVNENQNPGIYSTTTPLIVTVNYN